MEKAKEKKIGSRVYLIWFIEISKILVHFIFIPSVELFLVEKPLPHWTLAFGWLVFNFQIAVYEKDPDVPVR